MAHCTLLNNFIQNHVFIDDDEEDQDDHSKIKGLLFTFSFFFFCEIIFREKRLLLSSILYIWIMEMNKKSQNLTLWTWADRGQYLSTFEGVGGYVDPIWGELEQKKPQNQLFLRYFFRFFRDSKITIEISSMETDRL